MISPELISLESATGNVYLNHAVGAGTYSAVPAAATDGFRIRNRRGPMFDAVEFVYSYDATADATTTATVRPWFFVPDHDPAGTGGEWLAGKLIETIVEAEFSTDVNAPVKRINSIPNAATRLYLQVVSIAGTAPTNLYMTVYGLAGNVADVAGDGSGGGGGGSTTINNSFDGTGISTYQSPEDFTAAYNNATTLDLSELPFPPVIEQFRQVVVFDTDSNIKATYDVEPPEDWTWTPGADQSTGTLEITGANFAATDHFVVVIRGPVKSYLELMADMAGSGVHQSPRDFTAAYNNATTLDITGMDFDPALAQIRGVVEQATDGRVTMTYHPRNYEFTWTPGAAGAGQLEVANASFQATSAFIVFIEGTERGTKEAQTATALTTRVWPGQHVDDSGNIQPAGDVNARSIWHRLGNGTLEVLLSAANTARAAADVVLSTQHIDEAGEVLKSLATMVQSGYVKLTDSTRELTLKQADTVPTSSTIVVPSQLVDERGDIIRDTLLALPGTKSASQGHFTVAYTAATQLTLTGLSFTPENRDFVMVIERDENGDETVYTPRNFGMTYNSGTGVLTVTGATFSSHADATFDVLINDTPVAVDIPGNQLLTWRNNPAWEQNTTATLIDETNLTDDTYYRYVDMDGYTRAGFVLTLDGGSGTITVTVEGTTETGTPSTLTYRDITYDTFNITNTTTNDEWVDDAGKLGCYTYIRFKIVASTGGADDSDITITAKKLF